MKRSLGTLIIGLLLVVVFLFLLVSYTVRETEVAVLLTLEKPTAEISRPGFHFKGPWPIQKVEVFDKRLRIYRGTFEQTQTKDGKTIVLSVHAGWKIADGRAIDFRQRVGDLDNAERLLSGLIESSKNAVIRARPLSDLISVDPESLKIDAMEKEILEGVRKIAMDDYGIDVAFLGVERVALPDTVTQDVFQRMREERNRIAESYRADGRKRAEIIRATAESEKERKLAEAKSQALRILGEAEAEAAESYAVFTNDIELALFLQKLDALEETLKERATVVFDASRPPFDLLLRMPETPAGDAE